MVLEFSAQSSTMVTSIETIFDFSFPLNPVIRLSSQLVMVKLIDENFLIWKQQALAMIQGFSLESFIYGTSICPSEMTSSVNGSLQSMNLEYVTWQRQDQLLVSWILSSMSKSILPQMVGCNIANDIWRTLDKVFAIRCKAKIMQYKL